VGIVTLSWLKHNRSFYGERHFLFSNLGTIALHFPTDAVPSVTRLAKRGDQYSVRETHVGKTTITQRQCHAFKVHVCYSKLHPTYTTRVRLSKYRLRSYTLDKPSKGKETFPHNPQSILHVDNKVSYRHTNYQRASAPRLRVHRMSTSNPLRRHDFDTPWLPQVLKSISSWHGTRL
jgi:hypothetical protein